jgi:hypothetical protein
MERSICIKPNANTITTYSIINTTPCQGLSDHITVRQNTIYN